MANKLISHAVSLWMLALSLYILSLEPALIIWAISKMDSLFTILMGFIFVVATVSLFTGIAAMISVVAIEISWPETAVRYRKLLRLK